jgi:hypothetical protein
MPDVIIQDQNMTTGMLRITFEQIRGEGRFCPTIVAVAQMGTLVEEVKITPFHMNAKLLLGNDVVSQGSMRRCGREINHYPSQLEFDLPTTREAINFINDQFRESYLKFALHFDSLIY